MDNGASIGSMLDAFSFVSSPEHKVLRFSYCDSAVSVVRRPSSTFWLVYAVEVRLTCNFVRMFVLIKSRTSWKISYVGSNFRSLGQILEKPCVRSRGHIFSPIIMKFSQNVCLDEIPRQFENGSCQVKN